MVKIKGFRKWSKALTAYNELALAVKILSSAISGIGARDVAAMHQPKVIAHEG